MPEFVLDHGLGDGAAWYATLDSFTQGYVQGIFFTESGDDDGKLGWDANVSDLAPVARARIIEVCRDFQDSMKAELAHAYEIDSSQDDERSGVDFWLTRNGHGAGFWDRGLGTVGDELSAAAHVYGEEYLYRGDDGLIYL